jgi:HlyD family secretion protein
MPKPPKPPKRRIGLWLTVLLLIGAGAFGAWYWQNSRGSGPQYLTGAVTRGALAQLVTATGQLNPVVNVQVGSQVSGIIKKLFVDFNSPVKEGQVLAQLDPATYLATVHQNEADLANAKAGLELAKLTARRAEDLSRKNLAPQADFDKAMADLHQAEAVVKVKEATLERASVDFGRCTVYAPIDGIVISRHVDVGQTVTASLSAPTFFVIAKDLTQMQIDANVAEADVGGVRVGQEVEFTVDAFPNRVFKGKVIQIRNAPTMVQSVVTYDTVIGVDNRDLDLKPGMTANVAIVIARRPDALKIPNAALRFRPPEVLAARTNLTAATSTKPRSGSTRKSAPNPAAIAGSLAKARQTHRTVYILGSTNLMDSTELIRLEPIQIKTGISDGIFTEVLEGMSEGTTVVLGLNIAKAGSSLLPTKTIFGTKQR